jgi:UDP-glucose 4-epimerase
LGQVLITGGTGFVGGFLIRELLRVQHDVTVLTRQNQVNLPDAVNVTRGDISEPQTVARLLQDSEIDTVYHLAGLTGIRDSLARPAAYFRVNIGATSNILEAARSRYSQTGGTTKIVFASSRAVYSPSGLEPIAETHQASPTTPYGASKLSAENLIQFECATGAIGATTLRLFNIAGAEPGLPDQDSSRLVPRLLGAARGTFPPIRIDNPGYRRDFIHPTDVARAFAASADRAEAGKSHTYNIGSGTATSLGEIIRIVESISHKIVPLVPAPSADEPDRDAGFADIAKAQVGLDWKPFHSIEGILQTAWEFTA